MRTLTLDLGDRSYPIYIGDGLLSQNLLGRHLRSQQVMIVTSERIAPLYLDRVRQQLSSCQCDVVVLPDGEAHKNLATLEIIFDRLLACRHARTTTLVALGGGVIGDMTGFAAACYQRGVDFIQIPTTLLAQVDSSVGGKTAVNHPRGKNMIGAFHQPRAVLADTSVLATLPSREISAGLAEVIKYGLIRDRQFHDWLVAHMDKLLARDSASLAEAIWQSCHIKAEIVAADETEQGIRALLNLGHTFGHAIETATGYREWLHGEAVGCGMVMAAEFSARQGWLDADELASVRALVASAGLPVSPPARMSADDFLELMAVDKKVQDGKLRLVLLQSIGQAIVTSDFSRQLLHEAILDSCAREPGR